MDYFQQALCLAQTRLGFCAPNPSVGAVVVRGDTVVGQGCHQQCGAAHAEVVALQQAGSQAQGADIYVTLLPCHKQGRTPPCTQAIIAAGIARVFYAAQDPNQTEQETYRQLAEAGIVCQQVTVPEIDHFYRDYWYWLRHQQPVVTAKIACSLDGKIARQGQAVTITSQTMAEYTHHERYHHDAMLTSAQTIAIDNPRLTCRVAGLATIAKPLFILDRTLKTPENALIWQHDAAVVCYYSVEDACSKRLQALQHQGIECVAVPVKKAQLCWSTILHDIGTRGHHRLWVEAGGKVWTSLLQQQYLHRAWLYYGASLLGEHGVAAFCASEGYDIAEATMQWYAMGREARCQLTWEDRWCLPV